MLSRELIVASCTVAGASSIAAAPGRRNFIWRSGMTFTPGGKPYRIARRIFREHNELFTETSWSSVMVGQGVEAEACPPAADMLPDEEAISRLAHIRQVISQTASLMPIQRDYLRRQGSASNLVLHAS
jgi:hypothetical protein